MIWKTHSPPRWWHLKHSFSDGYCRPYRQRKRGNPKVKHAEATERRSESPVLQGVVPGDGEVETGLVDSCRVTVHRHHRGWTQKFGIKEFENIWKQRTIYFKHSSEIKQNALRKQVPAVSCFCGPISVEYVLSTSTCIAVRKYLHIWVLSLWTEPSFMCLCNNNLWGKNTD